MAAARPVPEPNVLTYEQYMAEGTVKGRYYILDGIRHFLAGASWKRQRLIGKVCRFLLDYEETSETGLAVVSPFDLLIRREPLRTRQPDVLFITKAQLERGGGIPEQVPLEVAPELVVDILDSETRRFMRVNLADYISIGVKECWRVWLDGQAVEVLGLSSAGVETVVTYIEKGTLQSLVFPDLTAEVAEIFK